MQTSSSIQYRVREHIRRFLSVCPTIGLLAWLDLLPAHGEYLCSFSSQTEYGKISYHMACSYSPIDKQGAAIAIKDIGWPSAYSKGIPKVVVPSVMVWSSGGSARAVNVIPSTIRATAFSNDTGIKTISIPQPAITQIIVPFAKGCSNLTSIQINERDSYSSRTDTFSTDNGVLYNQAKTTLIKYPEGRTATDYFVPATVTKLESGSFSNSKLKTLTFSGSAPEAGTTCFDGSSLSCLYPQGASRWTSTLGGMKTYAIPNAVKNVRASQGSFPSYVTITWTPNEVASSYVVYRAESDAGEKQLLASVAAGSTVFTDYGLELGKTYYYWVKAVNGPAEGAMSSCATGWTMNPDVTVALDLQGGSDGTTSVTATYGRAMPSIVVPARTGYAFGGYFTSTGGSGTQYYTSTGASARTWDMMVATTLYAKWTEVLPATQTVTFDANGGFCQTSTRTYRIEGSSYISLPDAFRTGHSFDGWFDDADGGIQITASTPISSSSFRTLYAHWTPIRYTVFFDYDGGTGWRSPWGIDPIDRLVEIIGREVVYGTAFTVHPPTRTGYRFSGWTVSSGLDASSARWVSESKPGSDLQIDDSTTIVSGGNTASVTFLNLRSTSGKVTLQAHWTACEYFVLFDRQGGYGGTDSIIAAYGSAMPAISVPTLENHEFGGYYTDVNGGGTQYYNSTGSSVRNWDRTEFNVTLYAKWTRTVSLSPVYRFYSQNYKGHFYTIDEAEMRTVRDTNPNWRYEGVAYHAYAEQADGTVPLYRFYSKNYRGHFFTIDENEMRTVRDTNPNWRYEGVAYYVRSSAGSGTTPVYRFWSKGYRHHFYTTSEDEKNTLIATNPNWKYEGIAFYAWADPGSNSSALPVAANSAAAEAENGASAGGDATEGSAGSGGAKAAADGGGNAVPVGGTEGVFPVGAWTVEVRFDAPDAEEIAEAEARPFEGPVAVPELEVALPTGTVSAAVWSATEGTVSDEENPGRAAIVRPSAMDDWTWVRAFDADGAETISLWLRLLP